jgi:hypothetical protein
MARDWEASNTLAMIEDRLEKYGVNIADLPISMTKELREDGYWWVVDLHIRVRRVTEFDISTEGRTLGAALRAAYLGLNNELGLITRAARANLVFGVAV